MSNTRLRLGRRERWPRLRIPELRVLDSQSLSKSNDTSAARLVRTPYSRLRRRRGAQKAATSGPCHHQKHQEHCHSYPLIGYFNSHPQSSFRKRHGQTALSLDSLKLKIHTSLINRRTSLRILFLDTRISILYWRVIYRCRRSWLKSDPEPAPINPRPSRLIRSTSEVLTDS